MRNDWVAWRQGYLGVWSLAHLRGEGEDGRARCGAKLGFGVEDAHRNLTHCSKCRQIAEVRAREKVIEEVKP